MPPPHPYPNPPVHPSYLLTDDPDISRSNGVWGVLRRLRNTPTESLPSLWKSQLLTTLHSLLTNILQPQLHTLLLTFSPNTNPSIPLTALPSPFIPLSLQITAHFLTHFILSPMEIVRTRLITLPSSLPSTQSSVGIFRNLVSHEGGFSTMYFHPNLFIPMVLEHSIRPILTLSIPLVLERYFQITPESSPVGYAAADLSLGLASLVVLLPIETVRKRLQLQYRGKRGRAQGGVGGVKGNANGNGKGKDKSIVRLRERDYVGVVEAVWRIVNEETGVRRKRVMTERDEGGLFSGIRQLYRGVSGSCDFIRVLYWKG